MEPVMDEINEEVLIDGFDEEQKFSFELPDGEFQWYVMFVSVTKEFKVRDRILRIDIADSHIKQVTLPTIPKLIYHKNKKVEKRELILSGYVFILCNLTDELCEKINGVEDTFNFLGSYRFSKTFDKPSYLTVEEIITLENGINKLREELNSPNGQFSADDYVKISNGIFRNAKGYVKEIRNHYVILELEDDVISKKITIDIDDIEKID